MSIVVVGGGPIGMLLGCLLAQEGIGCTILEKRTARSPHSRAIGLHPPALRVLERIGVADQFLACGVKVTGGQGFYERRALGRLSFGEIGGRYPFALAIPQAETERILERRLAELPRANLRKGVAVDSLSHLSAERIVGCDGTDSVVRRAAGIETVGAAYPDRYLMGDFADDTGLGGDAALFLTRHGIVESFPLPGKLRRWVVRLGRGEPDTPDAHHLSDLVHLRLARSLPVETCAWVSAFGVRRAVATRFVKGDVALAGDAAHVVSPIGGQGMTLGFLGAAALADALRAGDLSTYERGQRRLARIVAGRAALNTALGRPCRSWSPLPLLAPALLRCPPGARRLARQFTMSDL